MASLLKAYLRELPEPLMTFALYDKLLAVVELPSAERLSKVQSLFCCVPMFLLLSLSFSRVNV